MEDLRQEIGARLRECRKSKNLTQAQVAQKLNIPQQQYMRYENGHFAPSYENLIALCKLYEVTSDFVLGISPY